MSRLLPHQGGLLARHPAPLAFTAFRIAFGQRLHLDGIKHCNAGQIILIAHLGVGIDAQTLWLGLAGLIEVVIIKGTGRIAAGT